MLVGGVFGSDISRRTNSARVTLVNYCNPREAFPRPISHSYGGAATRNCREGENSENDVSSESPVSAMTRGAL